LQPPGGIRRVVLRPIARGLLRRQDRAQPRRGDMVAIGHGVVAPGAVLALQIAGGGVSEFGRARRIDRVRHPVQGVVGQCDVRAVGIFIRELPEYNFV